MRIAICDDEKIVSKELSVLIKKFNRENQLINDLVCFSRPSNLYDYMQESPVGIVFMDLEFSNSLEDGIEWSKMIRKKFPQTIIIILTAYERRYKEGFEARVFRFMTKPIIEKELFDNLKVSMAELQLTEMISLVRRGIHQNIRVKDIYYLSARLVVVNFGQTLTCFIVRKACYNGNRNCRLMYFFGVITNIW